MSKLSLSSIASGFRSSNKLNENFAAIRAAFDKTLSRDGSTPNQMEAVLDMNSNQIINVGVPVNPTDAVRLIDVDPSFSLNPQTEIVTNITALRSQTWGGGRPSIVFTVNNWKNGDGGRCYRWDPLSTASDNGGSIIKEDGTTVGRWVLQKPYNETPVEVFQLPNYGQNSQSVLQNAVAAANMGGVTLPDQQISLSGGVTSNQPVTIKGVSTGAGPGDSAQANSRVSQLMANGNFWTFEIDSLHPSYFDGIQFNQEPVNRPQTSGGGIRLITSAGSGATTANTIIDRISSTNKNTGIEFYKPCYPQIRGLYADRWTTAAVHYTTGPGVEGLGGLLLHPYLAGISGSTTQGGAILSRIGYTTALAPMLVGAAYGIDLSVRDNPAGRFGVFNGSIENQGIAAIRARTVDGQAASMFMVQGNEFSNIDFTSSYVSDVLIESYTGVWLDTVSISNNVHRHILTAAGYSAYDIRSGTGVSISNPVINILSTSGGGTNWQAVKIGAQAARVFVDNPLIVGTLPATPYILTTATTLFDIVNGITVAMLPTARDGSIVWCSDAIPGTFPVVTGGTGAMLIRQNGAWRPLTSTQAFRQNSGTQNSFVIGNSDGAAGSKLSFEQATGVEVHAVASEYISTSWRWRVKGASGILFELDSDGKPTFRPPTSATPVNNGDLVIQATSNTSLTFRLRGSDGTVRQASLTLS